MFSVFDFSLCSGFIVISFCSGTSLSLFFCSLASPFTSISTLYKSGIPAFTFNSSFQYAKAVIPDTVTINATNIPNTIFFILPPILNSYLL